jgi:polyphenol oxidase
MKPMMNVAAYDPDVVRVDALTALAGVRHGFFTRNGGASSGLYGSNNCAFGSDDSREVVAVNRSACAQRLDASALVTVKQRHTSDVIIARTPWTWDDAPEADALVTARRGMALGILTADCVPVLLADPVAPVIGAAHAGWRGAFDGILANTVLAMTKLGAERARIVAVVGPCIGQASYEVGPEFIARFIARDAKFARYFTPAKANGHAHFDIASFAADLLRAADVGTVVVQGSDTCAEESMFFSYRRSVLRGEPDYGRQLSAIALV